MNYLDNPMYPKDCIDYLVRTGYFELTLEGFLCHPLSCDDCPGFGRDIFCSIFKKDIESRKNIVAIVTTDYPEYFI